MAFAWVLLLLALLPTGSQNPGICTSASTTAATIATTASRPRNAWEDGSVLKSTAFWDCSLPFYLTTLLLRDVSQEASPLSYLIFKNSIKMTFRSPV